MVDRGAVVPGIVVPPDPRVGIGESAVLVVPPTTAPPQAATTKRTAIRRRIERNAKQVLV